MSNETTEIEWGFNCLTSGIHHGRPESLWNIPLLYAVVIYDEETLKEMVIARIYNDAMQIVEHNDKYDESWAADVKEIAEENYIQTLKTKVSELHQYYQSAGWELEGQETVRRIKEQKLNAHYEPLHIHDTINLLCRIIGTTASRRASD